MLPCALLQMNAVCREIMIARPILRCIGKVSRKLTIRLWSAMTVEEFHSIRIVDVRRRSGDFHATILASLELLKNTDSRRFSRVTKNLDWIVNTSLSTLGAEYWHWARACAINFEESWPDRDVEFSIGFHASLLIHEATHAYLEGLGIQYEESNRARIEELCVKEQNRWAANLENSDLGESLHQEFDPKNWDFCWNASRSEHIKATFRNVFQKQDAG